MFLLASTAEPNTNQIGLWVVICFGIVSGLSALVSLVSVFATKRELDAVTSQLAAHVAIHKEIFSKLGGVERGLRGEFREEMQSVREEIKGALQDVQAMTAGVASAHKAVEMLNQQIIEARSRIDHLNDK